MAYAAATQPPSGGYPRLASLMASSSEAAIFRQFRRLQMVNLLRLQATLQTLENEYREVIAEDAASLDLDRENLVNDFHLMRELAQSEDGESEQHDLLEKIGNCLKEYSENPSNPNNVEAELPCADNAAAQVVAISQAQKPRERDLGDLRKWLVRPSMGNNFLVGFEAGIWDKTNDGDFMSPASEDVGRFDSFLTGPALSGYHWLYGHRKEEDLKSQDLGSNLRLYGDENITRFADGLAAVLSSLLPTVMILVLYFINTMLWRLGALIIFTTIFSATLTIFTKAKKIEVFSATAAFAAVEVVFISSTNSS